jgi:hypothetical protein
LYRDSDVTDLDQRVGTALVEICVRIVALGGEAIRAPNNVAFCAGGAPPTTAQQKLDALIAASRWGVPVAIPTAPSDPTLDTRCSDVVRLLKDRVTECLRLRQKASEMTNGALPPTNRRIELLRKAVTALFGNTITVLPTFAVPATTLDAAFDRTGLLPAPLDEHRVRLWLQQVGLVHEPVGGLDDLMVMADAWRQLTPLAGTPALRLRLAQLPAVTNERWLALDDTERGEVLHADITTGRGRLSIVAATNDPSNTFPPTLAGVLVDQWDERVPSNSVDTSVAFQYDAPGNQAPQTLLLAVPGARDAAGVWSASELADIVRDTMDLAKIRAVDADAMAKHDGDPPRELGVGAVLPALMMAADPAKPGWARTAFASTVEEWVTALEYRPSLGADFAKYYAGQGFGPLFDEMGMKVRALAAGATPLVPFFVSAAGHQYDKGGIEFYWTAAPRGQLIIFSFNWNGLLSFALPQLPVLTGYNATGGIVAAVPSPGGTHSFAFPLATTRRVRITGGWKYTNVVGGGVIAECDWPLGSFGLNGVTWP